MSTSSSPPELKWNRFDALVALAVVLSLGLTIGLFMILPTFLAGLLGRFIPNVSCTIWSSPSSSC